jgi:hypothetical protein
MSILNLALILIVSAGTFNTGTTPASPTSSGRVTGIAVDPSDSSASTTRTGTTNGGVWKTTDGGSNW